MELLGTITPQEEQRSIQTTPTPVPPLPPLPDRGWTDWGVALGVAAWGGSKLWVMFSQQQSAEAALLQVLIKAVVDQNKILTEALLKKS